MVLLRGWRAGPACQGRARLGAGEGLAPRARPGRVRAPGSLALTLYPSPGADAARGRPAVLESEALVEHAVRATLVADALALQMRLPPPGAPAPAARASAAVAAGAPVVDALALTSIWAVHLLRTLCQARARARPAAHSR